MGYLLGIDVSTTGAKALLIDESGTVAASATTEYSLSTPQPMWSEQSPADWWEGTCSSVRAALARASLTGADITGVGLTGQMHGLVMMDQAGRVLRPAILWNDQRTARQCAEILERAGGLNQALEWTGNAVLPGFTAPKILWVREFEPHVYDNTSRVLLPKDYVRYCLTGEYATEVSDASGTSLLDVRRRQWSKPMLDALEIPGEWLPQCTESPEVSGRVSRAAARLTGLSAGTPVAGGAGDQAAQAVGSGVVRTGILSVTTGTSGVVFACSDAFAAEAQGRLHAFCHAVPGQWHLMGVMLAAGGSFRWLRDNLGEAERGRAAESGRDPYDLLTHAASQAPAGCDGLLFLPYLTGERTPHPDPLARGAFIGLTVRHNRNHLIRAVLEGVTFGLLDCLELIRGLGVPIEQVRASGGGARSALWRQIQADVFGNELVTVNVTEGAAFGAALLAGVGAGVFSSVAEAASRSVRIKDRVGPVPADEQKYRELYPLYRSLYPALQPIFHAMAEPQT